MATERAAARMPRFVNSSALAVVAVVVLVWQLAVQSGLIRVTFFPAPSAIVSEFAELLGTGVLVRDLTHTLSAALTGWFIGSAAGVVFGAALGASLQAWRWGMASVDVLRSIPAITFVPVAALLFGFSLQMELVVTTYAALWPVVVGTAAGVRGLSSAHRDVAGILHLGPLARLWKLALPAAAGSVIVGLRLALSLALTLAVASEMVGNPHGAGYALILQQQALNPAAMFAYIIAIGICGLVLNSLLGLAVRLLAPGVAASLKEVDA